MSILVNNRWMRCLVPNSSCELTSNRSFHSSQLSSPAAGYFLQDTHKVCCFSESGEDFVLQNRRAATLNASSGKRSRWPLNRSAHQEVWNWLIDFFFAWKFSQVAAFPKNGNIPSPCQKTTRTGKWTGLGPVQIRGADLPTGRLTTNTSRRLFNDSTHSLKIHSSMPSHFTVRCSL